MVLGICFLILWLMDGCVVDRDVLIEILGEIGKGLFYLRISFQNLLEGNDRRYARVVVCH